MAPFQMDVTLDTNFGSSIVSMAICSICLITRVYWIRRYKTQQTKLMLLGLLSILSAVLYCSALITKLMMRKYRYRKFPVCMMIYVASRSLYAMHRAFLYAFVVWRIELVNSSKIISRSTIRAAKFIIIACSIFLVVGMGVFIESKSKKQPCLLNVNIKFLIAGWILDIVICLMSSWLFLRPLLRTLKVVDDFALQETVKKEALCISISLLSTVTTAVFNYLVEGIMGISIGIDCSITSCCIVNLASPASNEEKCCFFYCIQAKENTSSRELRSTTEVCTEELISPWSSTKWPSIEVGSILWFGSVSSVERESVSAFG